MLASAAAAAAAAAAAHLRKMSAFAMLRARVGAARNLLGQVDGQQRIAKFKNLHKHTKWKEICAAT